MSFNTDADKFWRILTWTVLLGMLAGAAWWAYASHTPDLPFSAWLMNASRDDVWRSCFSCIFTAVAVARICTRK